MNGLTVASISLKGLKQQFWIVLMKGNVLRVIHEGKLQFFLVF